MFGRASKGSKKEPPRGCAVCKAKLPEVTESHIQLIYTDYTGPFDKSAFPEFCSLEHAREWLAQVTKGEVEGGE